MKWVKINNVIYYIIDVSIQLSVGSHATIYLIFDISKNKSYQDSLIKLYENQKNCVDKDIKFTILNNKFIGSGSVIKSIDIDFDNKMIMTIRCDYLQHIDINERRDLIIDEVLNETLQNKNNIN